MRLSCCRASIAFFDLHVVPECRPDDDDEEEEDEEEAEAARRKKKIPGWARGQVLLRQLEGQRDVDPDEVFRPHLKTCSLDEVFKLQGEHSDSSCSQITTHLTHT